MNFSKVAKLKSPHIRKLICEALDILSAAGVKTDDLTSRRQERMAMAFLAVANKKPDISWSNISRSFKDHILRSREIISFMNTHFEENLSSGSYDDIRRKDLRRPVIMGLIVKSARNPNSDTNDGTRGNAISEQLSNLAQTYGTSRWQQAASNFEPDPEVIVILEGVRKRNKIEVRLPSGYKIQLDGGPHNQIQSAVVKEFLPRFGHGAELYYIGDTNDKGAYKDNAAMLKIGLTLEDRGMLPDIVAFSESKKWVYLIEAVHSSNPLNPERCIELSRTVLKNYAYGVVLVTAFLTKKDFVKWATQIAWETEVWIVDQPDHMIHFNGDRFMGPHDNSIYKN